MTRSGSSSASHDDLVVAMTGASGAPYAVRLLQVLVTVRTHDSPDTEPQRRAGASRRDGPGSVTRLVRSQGLWHMRGGPPDLSSLPGFRRGHRQRFVPDRRHGDRSVQHEHIGCDRRWNHHQSHHPRPTYI